MKSLVTRMGALLLLAVLVLSCVEDEKLVNEKFKQTFSISLGKDSQGRREPMEFPEGASLLLSLSGSDGELILDQQEIPLQRRGGAYVSEAVEVPSASYTVVDFMVVDDELNVLYATPHKGSALSDAVAQSLPFSLASGSFEGDIDMEVIDTRNKSPKSFGYDAFRRRRNSIKLQVFVPNGGHIKMTTAEALVMRGLDTLSIYQLQSKMNTIPFNGTPGETYTLVVVKDSYARYARNFTVNDPAMTRRPLWVVLKPALSVVAVPIQNYFGMQFDAWGVFEFNVDWGDGTHETWTSGITTLLEHYYAQPGKYFVSVTGHALDSALMVGDVSGGSNIERLGMQHLTNLRDFRIEWSLSRGPKIVDLSHNHLINEIRIFQTALEDLDIPNDAAIYILELIENTNLKNESLNEIIFDLHHQVVNSPPHTGDFLFYMEEDGQFVPITEPTPEAREKLRELKHDYGWVIVPDPDLEGS